MSSEAGAIAVVEKTNVEDLVVDVGVRGVSRSRREGREEIVISEGAGAKGSTGRRGGNKSTATKAKLVWAKNRSHSVVGELRSEVVHGL